MNRIDIFISGAFITLGGIGILQQPNPVGVGLLVAGVLVLFREPALDRLSDWTISWLELLAVIIHVLLAFVFLGIAGLYFLTPWTGFESVARMTQEAGIEDAGFFYIGLPAMGCTFLLIVVGECLDDTDGDHENSRDEPPQYGYNDQWERENL